MSARTANPMDLQLASRHCRLLADPTRIRLLLLLDREELSVAELAAITQLAQPRVSTHLAKLREAGLVTDRRDGVSGAGLLPLARPHPLADRIGLVVVADRHGADARHLGVGATAL